MKKTIPKKLLITGGSGFIGTNLIELAKKNEIPLLNIDIHPPLYKDHVCFWRQIDILDFNSLKTAFVDFQPDWVVHLAARTDCDETTTVEDGYQVNTIGTKNILNVVQETLSVSRLIVTSTQYVCRPGVIPKSDCDYDPHTIYGQSKVITEQLTRQANLACTWTIIRPTNIWGPWHLRYRAQFLRILRKGLYFHPRGRTCTKSYGYVENVAHQIIQILNVAKKSINGQILYVGDPPIDLLTWINTFSQELCGRPVNTIPYPLMKLIAKCGDVISTITGNAFIINSSRFRSMTEDYITPMDKTFMILGKPPFSLEGGVRKTVQWLREFESLSPQTQSICSF